MPLVNGYPISSWFKNKFLGGEGLFNTVVTGPGRIVVQTMPISAVANSLARFFPQGK